MNLAAPTRRTLGLAAVSAIAMSSAVLSLGGVASAAELTGATTGLVPADTCGVEFVLSGAAGGDSADFAGGDGDTLTVTMAVEAGAPYAFDQALISGGAGGTGAGDGGDAMALKWDGSVIAVAAGGGGAGVGAAGGTDSFGGDPVDDGDGDDFTDGTYYGGYGGYENDPGLGGELGQDVVDGVVGSDATAIAGGAGAPGGGGGGGGSASGGGGAGASDGSTGAGGGGGYTMWPDFETLPVVDVVVSPNAGVASASYEWVACPPLALPSAPDIQEVEAGDGSAIVQVWPPELDELDTSAVTYQYRVGGDWKPLDTAPVWDGADLRVGTISGLTNGTTYSVEVRAVSAAAGAGAASDPVSVTPYAVSGAPTDVKVTTTATAVTVTWAAPTVAGTFPIAGYVVGMGAGESGGEVCETAADVFSCVVTGVQIGVDYSVVVFAVDNQGNAGEGSPFVMTGAIPAPATVPASNGPLAGTGFSAGSVTAGQTITVSGTGYAPFSTVTVLVYSSPTVLGTAVADEHGAFTFTGKLPAGLAAGSHTLVAAGVDANGNPYYLTQSITVGGGATGTGSGGLAYTGADIAVPAIGGLAALAIGGGLVVAGRRRRTAE